MTWWLRVICIFVFRTNVYIYLKICISKSISILILNITLFFFFFKNSYCVKHMLTNIIGAPGTDATHAEHIETIKSRTYVGLTSDQRFLPGALGMGLVEGTYGYMH